MGSWFSLSMPCDQVNKFSDWLCLKASYIHNLSVNLESLEKTMRLLKAKRDDVQRKVDREEFTRQCQRLSRVQVWLLDILEIENQYNDLIRTSELERQRLCLCGFCSKYLKLSYHYGKKVREMLGKVERLISQGVFDVVTDAVPITEVNELPIQPKIVGQETILEKIWNRLVDDKSWIVGLYEMGGVGKSTILAQINNKFLEIGGIFVICVVVSKDATACKIQGDIGKKLGLSEKSQTRKTITKEVLTSTKFLRGRILCCC